MNDQSQKNQSRVSISQHIETFLAALVSTCLTGTRKILTKQLFEMRLLGHLGNLLFCSTATTWGTEVCGPVLLWAAGSKLQDVPSATDVNLSSHLSTVSEGGVNRVNSSASYRTRCPGCCVTKQKHVRPTDYVGRPLCGSSCEGGPVKAIQAFY